MCTYTGVPDVTYMLRVYALMGICMYYPHTDLQFSHQIGYKWFLHKTGLRISMLKINFLDMCTRVITFQIVHVLQSPTHVLTYIYVNEHSNFTNFKGASVSVTHV